MSMFATAIVMLAMQALTLQGIVFKKGTNEPLSNAIVELHRDQENAAILARLTTEDDGRFLFDRVTPGRYRVTVTRRGYVRPPLTIIVAANQAGSEIRLPMTQTGTISGRVYDTNGQPLGNMEVLAMKASYPEGRRILVPVQSAITNDLGEYRLFWLTPGRYYVSAVHPKAQGMFRRMSNLFGMSVSTSGTSISMYTAAANSDPALGGLELEPEPETERYAPVFWGGTLDQQLASSIDIRAGADAGGVNIMIAPVRARHVRGIVVDGLTGRPARYASLTLAQEVDGPRAREPEVDPETATFDLLLLPGVYTVYANSASGEGSVTFQLGDADIDSLTIPTTPVFDIPGRIVFEGEPNSGAVLGALRITLRHDPPREEPRTASLSYSTPLPNGSFTLSAPAGNYRVNIAPLLNVTPVRFPAALSSALQNAYVKWIRLGNVDVLNGTLRLESKPAAPLEVVIGRSAGGIDGQVVMNRQESGADVSVVLLPNIRHRTELYRTTTTDVAGRFHFDRVPPGDYKVFSWEEVQDGAWYDPEFLRANEHTGVAVRILEGFRENVRVEVVPPQ